MTGLKPFVFLALAAFLAAACTAPPVALDTAGRLEVLGPNPGFSPAALPADWAVEGPVADGRVSIADVQGVPALRLVAGDDGYALVRRTAANVLVMPYLSWAWNIEVQRSGPHPVRLLVGFDGGNPDGTRWGGGGFGLFGSSLPGHDRMLNIAWGESALERGSLIRPSGKEPRVPRYTIRGGRENAGTWWVETVDLSQLYAIAWPHDDIGRVTVTFVGLAVVGSRLPTAAHVSGIVLSR